MRVSLLRQTPRYCLTVKLFSSTLSPDYILATHPVTCSSVADLTSISESIYQTFCEQMTTHYLALTNSAVPCRPWTVAFLRLQQLPAAYIATAPSTTR